MRRVYHNVARKAISYHCLNRTLVRTEDSSHRKEKNGYDYKRPRLALLWVFTDEHPDTINDACLIVMNETADPNQWADMPDSFHNGACVFNFADGHNEMHKWRSPKTRTPVAYSRKAIQDPGSVDIEWTRSHTTVMFP